MRLSFSLPLITALCTASSVWLAAFASGAEPVGKEEAAKLTRWAIPLPREIVIDAKIDLPANQIAVATMPDAEPLERIAASELVAVLGKKTKSQVSSRIGWDFDGGLEIVLGCCKRDGKLDGREVPGAARLFTLSNPEQAYRIVPLGEHTLALVGTDPQGVFYAAKTLKQLLSAPSSAARGHVAIPLPDITDWPDLPERGIWGGNAEEDLEWLADRKMNLVESDAHVTVGDDGQGVATMKEELLTRAERNAIKLVPIISHLEQLSSKILEKHPELKAVGDYAAWRKFDPNAKPLCFAQPGTEQLITDWFNSLTRYPQVENINVWLAEEKATCQCEKCKAVDPYVQQVQVVARAWRAAKRYRRDLRIRILLTQGSYDSNAAVLAAVPPELGITYYDGRRTYDSSREPMIYSLLEKYAAEGHWLGCYPQLTASWRVVCPWTAPQFIKARMTEFVSKKLHCLCGYATPSDRFYEFNVTAAAEWSWNVNGRSDREFAAAWATRQGLSDPDKAADWAVTIGPVGWDLHGGRALLAWCYGDAAYKFEEEKPLQLGGGILRYFPSKEHFDEDLAACNRAMTLAEELKSPALIEETHVTRGLVELFKGLYLFSEATAAGEKMTAQARKQAADGVAIADRASQEARHSLLAWAKAVAPKIVASGKLTSRFTDTRNCLDWVVGEMSKKAVALKIPDPGLAYRLHRIGEWTADDCQDDQLQQKTWAAGNFISKPGRYEVMFIRDSREYEVRIKDVRLVSGPANDLAKQTELVHDTHDGESGSIPSNTYHLVLKEHDPKQQYFIVADLAGAPVKGSNEAAGLVGHVTMKLLRETEEDVPLPAKEIPAKDAPAQ